MSCYETHRGILRKVNTNGLTAEEFLKTLIKEDYSDYENIYDLLYSYDLYDKYIYINGTLYEWINHICKFDEEESFCELTPLEDNTIQVFAQFYNGGCCLEEILEEKLK